MSESVDPLFRIVKHLDASSSPADQAAACATIAILCSQSTPPEGLDGVCEKLITLLDGQEIGVKPNALAALSAGMEVSEPFYKDAVTGGLSQKLVSLLTAATASDVAADTATDTAEHSKAYRQIILNSLTALGGLGECSEEGLQSVLDAGGVAAVISYCSSEHDILILEAAVDSLCKLMSSGAGAKEAALKENTVPKLAKLLSTDGKTPEITVRALLGLGMLLGMAGSEQAQLDLATAPGAVGALLSLMRQGDDGDIQHIAAGLFSGLASAPAAKDALATAMREAQAKNDASAKYVS